MHHLADIAAQTLARALAGEDAEVALAATLRALKLPNEERARLSRWVLGSSCLRAMLAFRSGRSDPASLIAAYQAFVELEPPRIEWPSDPLQRICVEASLPTWIAHLWLEKLGFESSRSLALSMNTPGPTMLRANALHTNREALAAKLGDEGIATEPGKLAPNSLRVIGRANLWGSAAWRQGLFEVQDEGSQLIIEACRVQPGERWLDLCAGAGGKTLGLAAAGANVVAHDIDEKRLTNLAARLKRARVTTVQVVREQPTGQFDGVLVDAPCSELGTLRRHPDARWRIQPDAVADLPKLQRELLERARGHSDRVVYATCTLRRAENEDVAGVGRTLRPDVEGTDGFFIAG